MNTMDDCKDCESRFADLLLDPAAVTEATRLAVDKHTRACAACSTSFMELQKTMALMDEWTVPEPSPFFDTRLHARLREAQAEQPEGFFERVRSFLLFSTGRQLRPAVAGALALVLVASGGSLVAVNGLHANPPARPSATVEDLRVLDNNVQALQQMDQLLDDSGDDSDASPST